MVRVQAEDVVQDSLASVWLTRHRLDPDKPIGPYLTTVVLNRCRDRLRRLKVAGFFGLSGDDELHSIADDLPGPEALAVSREELNLVQAEIARMPVRLREALMLVTIEGRSQAEAADLLGTTEKAIETRVYRARNRLKERFEKLFEGGKQSRDLTEAEQKFIRSEVTICRYDFRYWAERYGTIEP